MANFYCEYCGQKASSISSLTAAKCPRHPNGRLQGQHKLYEGSEKSQYVCKYCGIKHPTILGLTAAKCPKHPNGRLNGNHAPAL